MQTVSSDSYSFRTDFPSLSKEVCDLKGPFTDSELRNRYANGVGFDSFTLDASTRRIPTAQLKQHVEQLKRRQLIPDFTADMNSQVDADNNFYRRVQLEYCYYENRYRFALRRFIELATSETLADIELSKRYQDFSISLNKHLQSILEILNHLADERARSVNNMRSQLKKSNTNVSKNINELASAQQYLTGQNVILSTQKEMVDYTQQKNRSLKIQIAVFAVLNVFALAAVFGTYNAA